MGQTMSHPTLEDIARESGVSPATVSRVLNHKDNVAEKTRHKVLAAMQILGRGTPPKQLIGLIVPDFRNPFFATLHYEFEKVLEPYDAHLLTASSDGVAHQ